MEEMTNVIEEVVENGDVVETLSNEVLENSKVEVARSGKVGLFVAGAVGAAAIGKFAWDRFKEAKKNKRAKIENEAIAEFVDSMKKAGESEEKINQFIDMYNSKEKKEVEVKTETEVKVENDK